MRRIIALSMIIALLLVCLSSCVGYNQIMRDHLSNPASYHSYTVVVKDMYFQDADKKNRDFSSTYCLNFDATLVVFLPNIKDALPFLGSQQIPESAVSGYELTLCISARNSKILFDEGFYQSIQMGDEIQIRASNWIYMDGTFFYVAELKYQGIQYLYFEDGLQNIITMMDEKKSLF